MLTISKAAKTAGLTVDTIRHYVEIGLIHPQRDPDNNYQIFAKNELNRLHFIKIAKELGFTLKELQTIFKEADKGDSPCPLVRSIIENHLDEISKKIKALQVMQYRMEQALNSWKSMPDGMPDGHSICHLIESQ